MVYCSPGSCHRNQPWWPRPGGRLATQVLTILVIFLLYYHLIIIILSYLCRSGVRDSNGIMQEIPCRRKKLLLHHVHQQRSSFLQCLFMVLFLLYFNLSGFSNWSVTIWFIMLYGIETDASWHLLKYTWVFCLKYRVILSWGMACSNNNELQVWLRWQAPQYRLMVSKIQGRECRY